jgi:hypothetical protein
VVLPGDVDRHPRSIDDESDRRRRGDKRFLFDIEAEERDRTDPALIADQAAEQSGESAGKPYRNFRTSRSSGDRRDSITKRAAGIVVAAPTSASVSPALRLVRLFSPRLASRATPAPDIARVLTMKKSFGRVRDRRFMMVFSWRFACNSHANRYGPSTAV